MRTPYRTIAMLVYVLLAGCTAGTPGASRAPRATATQAVHGTFPPAPDPVAVASPAASATPAFPTVSPTPLSSATPPSPSPTPPQGPPPRTPIPWDWGARPTPAPTPFPVPPLQGTLYLVRQDTLVAADLSTGTERAIARGEHFELAPDGASLVVMRGQTLELLSMSGELRGQLSDVERYGAAWAPNSQSVAVVRCRGTDCNAEPEIWLLERESGRSFKLADGFGPRWAPDSSAIAFGRCPDAVRECPGEHQIWLAVPGGGEPQMLAQGWHTTWSPDSQRIAYLGSSRKDPEAQAINLINRRGEHGWSLLQTGVAPAGIPMPRLALRSIFWSRDGRSIYVQTLLQQEWALSTVDLLERVNTYSGAAETVAVMLDSYAREISPDGRSLIARGSGPAVIPMLDVYQLFDEPQLCAAVWCQAHGLELRVFARLAWVHTRVYDYSWSPDGRLLALHICPPGPEVATDDPNARCSSGGQPVVQLLDPATGGLSTPVLQDVDVLLSWRS